MTPTDGAGAVPAGGGSSLPLPGGPGIDPAGITTGARGASLKRDAKAKVTPAHCIARSAAWIELRRFGAAVRAAVGRRKASAPRSARAASDDAAHSFAPFGALPPLIFWRRKIGGFGRHNSGAAASRERDCFPPSAQRGRVDHWSSRSERTVVEGAPDAELRCRLQTVSLQKRRANMFGHDETLAAR